MILEWGHLLNYSILTLKKTYLTTFQNESTVYNLIKIINISFTHQKTMFAQKNM